jgi:phospholipid/cholesterol/gamma-HCH transport system substrate-binding protein
VAALVGAAILAGLGYTALTAGNGLPLTHYYYLNAEFANAAEIDPYSDVRIAGVLVGQVLGSSFEHGSAVLRLQLKGSVQPLRSGTTARIRLQGLIGARYVQLVPGRGGRPLPSGATIPRSRTSTAVGVFDVLSMFDQRRRDDLRGVLGGLGEGFLGRGAQLNQAIQTAPAVIGDLGKVSAAVNAQPGAAARLVPGAQRLSAAVYPARAALAAGFAPAADAIEPFTAERRRVQTTLEESPGALRSIRQGLVQSDPLLAQTAGLSHALVRLTGPAPAALERATTLLRSAKAPLRRTKTLLGSIASAVPPTLTLTGSLAPLAEPTARSLSNTIPGLGEIARYRCDIEGWIRDWSSVFSQGTPPDSAIGPAGLARASVAANERGLNANVPGALPARYYEAPCTASLDRAP